MPDAIFLSKFSPLPRIFFADDFDEGVNGWCELIGNHDGDLNNFPHGSNLQFFLSSMKH